jgi:chorismate mutase/prephenate dehydratase
MDIVEKSLEKWRREIDILDTELLRLLNQRARIACELGALKISSGQPVYDGRRERQVLVRLVQSNSGPLDSEAVTSIFRAIIRESRRLEKNTQQETSSKPETQSSTQEFSHGH